MTRSTLRDLLLAGLATALTAPAGAASFDDQRLFTTAEQRARIEGDGADARASDDRETVSRAASNAEEVVQHPRPLVLKGLVRRPGAPAVFWLGARRFREGQTLPAAWPARRGRVDGDGVVLTLADGRRVRLEPGEALEPNPPVESPHAP